jgi:hypothetical protein
MTNNSRVLHDIENRIKMEFIYVAVFIGETWTLFAIIHNKSKLSHSKPHELFSLWRYKLLKKQWILATRLAQEITLLTCIREVSGWILVRGNENTEIFCIFQ